MTFVVTRVTAPIAPGRQADLERAFHSFAGNGLPAGAVESRLVRCCFGDWRIETIWTRRALHQVRQSPHVPAAVNVFRSVGAEPEVTFFDPLDRLGTASHCPVPSTVVHTLRSAALATAASIRRTRSPSTNDGSGRAAARATAR